MNLQHVLVQKERTLNMVKKADKNVWLQLVKQSDANWRSMDNEQAMKLKDLIIELRMRATYERK